MFLELDVVTLLRPISKDTRRKSAKGIRPGMRGTIVHCYEGKDVYEVEFIEDNETLGISTVRGADLALYWRSGSRVLEEMKESAGA